MKHNYKKRLAELQKKTERQQQQSSTNITEYNQNTKHLKRSTFLLTHNSYKLSTDK